MLDEQAIREALARALAGTEREDDRCSLEALHAYDDLGRPRALGSTPNELPRALREHVAILAALRARDAELAEARMRAHVLRSLVTNRVLAPTRKRKP